MRAAQSHYNDTVTSLVGKQGLHGKVERFQQLSAKANKTMPAVEPIHDNLEANRLESLTGEEGGTEAQSNAEPEDSAKAQSSGEPEGASTVKHLHAEKKDS